MPRQNPIWVPVASRRRLIPLDFPEFNGTPSSFASRSYSGAMFRLVRLAFGCLDALSVPGRTSSPRTWASDINSGSSSDRNQPDLP